MSEYIEFKNISKSFGKIEVLHDISFSIKQGEIHALLGENGAGKSTLLNIFHGVYQDYTGEIFYNHEPVRFKSVFDANQAGIAKVHQEINLVNELTVGENIALGQEDSKGIFIDRKKIDVKANEILDELGCVFRSRTKVASLTAGEKQMVLIAKALYANANTISFDEPTAALSNNEIDHFFATVKKLKAKGVTIIYVSHRLAEIFQICDRVTVFLDGKYVDTYDAKTISKEKLIHSMVGRDVEMFAQRKMPKLYTDEVAIKVEDLHKDKVFTGINFQVRKGEIFGLYGLVGSKRTDVVRAIFGAEENVSGNIYIDGELRHIHSTSDAIKYGIGLVPEERKSQGFIKVFNNSENITLTDVDRYVEHFIINDKKKRLSSEDYIEKLNVHPRDSRKMTATLSGGNQQKVVIAKWLHRNSNILILDEPTKGIDVGAKEEIYNLLEELASQGKTIIIVSSELPEIVGLCDTVMVMSEGKQVALLKEEHINEKEILKFALGGDSDE
ncbi:sugar ABC transporter ATP-binding protein [Hujiaoplasma nucleasis]|uniref:Sugar ABC transporter ATP-binding protein n=1 Tax=Hujiaoplasma nucleasis TaxID=2725268 RepID=A0A7L6N7V4_9MOLU|nr:sugar ABC transporter ATP-binding protein [Hujiaoplasma nucleasis]QLY40619.1 sugar ABC transporter ATP-binding protein [Hujiaoplasma nucleasis]